MVEISKYKQSPAAPSDEASRTGTLNTFQQEYAKSVIPRWKKRNRGYKPLMNMLTAVTRARGSSGQGSSSPRCGRAARLPLGSSRSPRVARAPRRGAGKRANHGHFSSSFEPSSSSTVVPCPFCHRLWFVRSSCAVHGSRPQ